ncbi:uncharacterized protein LOC121726092 [Aricia agestis]|uniref:uncharacterized protein LOC121726092 n=1 Tax=Aricia agestis TaxID=91739 RepID=UPI001C2085AF|nr:uncharacterized protein LOC121726092 [Aricia agestis]
MQLRLRGSARRWYDELDDYNLDWDAWKRALEIAFPRSVDFVDKLSTMLARNKEESETMTRYYHDKLSLLRKCNISGEDAISCIIRGLPVELRANAKAYKCETPEMLYFGYLSSLENYKRDNISSLTSRKSSWRRGAAEENSTTAQRSGVKRCYICRRIGHEFRDCRAQQRCDICQRNGHTSASCWLAATPGPSRQQVQPTPVSLLMLNLNDKFWSIYKRLAFVGTSSLVVYIDTGSKLNVLSLKKAKELELQILPSNIVMKGFGGAHTQSLGRSHIKIYIDNLYLKGDVEVTNCNMCNIDLIIGQSMINQIGVSLVTTSNSAKFIATYESYDTLRDIKLNSDDFDSKYNVFLKCDVTVPPQSLKLLNVFVDYESNENVYFLTNSVYVEIGKTSYAIPGGVICIEGYLKFFNFGEEPVSFSAHRLIARAVPITTISNQITQNVMTVDFSAKTNSTHLTDLGEIDVGDLEKEDLDKLITLLNKYDYLFARDSKDLGCTDLMEMHIRTTTDRPVHFKPYRLSYKENQIVMSKVQDLIDAGIVRESMSEYASPVVLVTNGGESRGTRLQQDGRMLATTSRPQARQ